MASKTNPAPTQLVGICAHCAQAFVVKNGRLVDHGFQVPGYGHRDGQCPGVGTQPVELSPVELAKLAGFAAEALAQLQRLAAPIPLARWERQDRERAVERAAARLGGVVETLTRWAPRPLAERQAPEVVKADRASARRATKAAKRAAAFDKARAEVETAAHKPWTKAQETVGRVRTWGYNVSSWGPEFGFPHQLECGEAIAKATVRPVRGWAPYAPVGAAKAAVEAPGGLEKLEALVEHHHVNGSSKRPLEVEVRPCGQVVLWATQEMASRVFTAMQPENPEAAEAAGWPPRLQTSDNRGGYRPVTCAEHAEMIAEAEIAERIASE